ncbi:MULTISPECIES: hypothetical protein [Eikenella]|uniref:DUF4034 domain-containing protein n=1 Tax=Eikenella exigua TaxID=2528037 RepID=A0AAX1F731_9NEIS|nr:MULTISPECIES: hypothetical protein [Eikenella]OAM40841.1 hypothetical protein A7Q02_05665 [Eikenella sp. NML97-A-109]QED91710.1 hypothetical protein EZJ17_02975 [Eikenella exigua]
MNHLKYLFGVIAILILSVVSTLYLFPEWLKQREIRAAEADLALLATPPAPPSSVKNGIDALWLLEYRTADDAERADLTRCFDKVIQYDNDASVKYPELAAKYLSPPDDILKFNGTATEYLAEIRADLPQYRTESEKHAELFANVDKLADYDTFAPRDWPNDEEDLTGIRLPRFQFVAISHVVAALDWVQGREHEAWRRVCRNIKTGRSLLHSRPGLIYPMIGNAIILRNTDLAAQMLYEKPEWANRLPDECGGMFDVLTEQEQSICLAVQDEFRLSANLQHKLENEVQQMTPTGQSYGPRVLDTAHNLAMMAPYYAVCCKPEAATILQADQKAPWQPSLGKTLIEKWACVRNSVGCLTSDIAIPSFGEYIYRLQGAAMQQRAFQATLALYCLPVDNRRAALESILAEHSSPSRKLRWNEQERIIYFDAYSPSKAPDPIPFNLDAGR